VALILIENSFFWLQLLLLQANLSVTKLTEENQKLQQSMSQLSQAMDEQSTVCKQLESDKALLTQNLQTLQ
jgi:hypothetical protein